MQPQPPTNAIPDLGDRYLPKPAGTKEDLKFYFGPYVVPPGHDANRIDIELPLMTGYIQAIEPAMRRVNDLTEPSHQEAHIHHAHWFALDPGNQEDNYTFGNTEWVFGNGDEETRADFQERSAADPNGPVYGQYVDRVGAAADDLHAAQQDERSAQRLHRARRDLRARHRGGARGAPRPALPATSRACSSGGPTTCPREPAGDGVYEVAKDSKRGPIEWTSTIDGTIIGTGGHLHPGGLSVIVENYGSKDNPCPDDGRGYGGTRLLKSDALFRNALYSEDFQMEVSHPAWRAPLHKGDRIRISGTYENKDHAWYDVMTHEGLYVDESQPPQGRCKPKLINQPKAKKGKIKPHRHRHRGKKGRLRVHRRWHRGFHLHRKKVRGKVRLIRHRHKPRRKRVKALDPTVGVPNRAWGHHADLFCGELFGGAPCDRPEQDRGPGMQTSEVTIADFLYLPGDRTLAGQQGAPARVKRGTSLTFVNADQPAGIRHSVTTCAWPCNGPYVGNYPLPDGTWDSTTLGYDPIDGGNPNPVASTPSDLAVGKYAYFCRIHPWMRGAFEVVE